MKNYQNSVLTITWIPEPWLWITTIYTPIITGRYRPIQQEPLQHPEKFYFWQLQAVAQAQVTVKKGLYLTAEYAINIVNNYDKGYDYHWPDGQLYHVRQNRRLYLRAGERKMLRKLALDYLVDLHPNVKGKISPQGILR